MKILCESRVKLVETNFKICNSRWEYFYTSVNHSVSWMKLSRLHALELPRQLQFKGTSKTWVKILCNWERISHNTHMRMIRLQKSRLFRNWSKTFIQCLVGQALLLSWRHDFCKINEFSAGFPQKPYNIQTDFHNRAPDHHNFSFHDQII